MTWAAATDDDDDDDDDDDGGGYDAIDKFLHLRTSGSDIRVFLDGLCGRSIGA